MVNTAQNDTAFAAFRERLAVHKDNFVSILRDINPKVDAGEAETLYNKLVEGLYANRIDGNTKAYGEFSEEDRIKAIDGITPIMEEIAQAADMDSVETVLLWSNRNVGKYAAESTDIREASGVDAANSANLEETPLGRLMEQATIFNTREDPELTAWNSNYICWAASSRCFAARAQGEVHFFMPRNIGALSIFWNVELQELQKRMAPNCDPPKITALRIHQLADDAFRSINDLDELKNIIKKQQDSNELTAYEKTRKTELVQKYGKENELKKAERSPENTSAFIEKLNTEQREIAAVSGNWQEVDYNDANLQIPRTSSAQQKQFNETIKNTQNSLNLWSYAMTVYPRKDTITVREAANWGKKWHDKTRPDALKRYIKQNENDLTIGVQAIHEHQSPENAIKEDRKKREAFQLRKLRQKKYNENKAARLRRKKGEKTAAKRKLLLARK